MFILKFVSSEGVERSICGYSYNVAPRDGWVFVTVDVRDHQGVFESNYCVGKDQDWCSLFVMNFEGKTLEKHVS